MPLRPITHGAAPPLDPDSFAGNVDVRTLVDMAYHDAACYLDSRRDAGVPLTPKATQMHDAPPGVTFRETMAGPFALGETDPEAGAARGARAGTSLAIHATVTVRDVPRFVADPRHTGELVGEIDFGPFGSGVPARAGVFNLFAPGGAPGLKRMVYELGFEHGGKRYYLAGKKEVRDDRGADLLRDTTTLYTRLHQGVDASGPVVGAGVLRLGVGDFASLLSTIRPVGATTAGEGASVVGQFARFFAGQLVDTYGAAIV